MSLDVNVEPEEYNTEQFHKYIEEVARIKGIENFEYEVEFACGRNDNFTSNILRVVIHDSEKEKHASVIVKTQMNTTKQDLFHGLYEREVFVYKEVFPKFNELQECIAFEKRVMLPKCVFSNLEKEKEVVILEDLVAMGFKMDNTLAKFEKLDYLQVRLVVSELAKFHGLTFVLKKNEPETFERFSMHLHDIIFDEAFLNKGKLRTYHSDLFELSLNEVKDEVARKKLQNITPKLLQTLRKFVKSQRNKQNVFCHGDFWINNILFKHEEKKESQVCFLDFQAMRCASPALDLVYFLYLCTDPEFRSAYFETLINVYYESLKHFLRLFDTNVNDVYSYEDFHKDVEDALPFGVLIAIIDMRMVTSAQDNSTVVPNVLTESEDINQNEDFSRSRLKSLGGKLFTLKINDVVTESIDNGVLDKLLMEINSES